jgi:hypothetical protein
MDEALGYLPELAVNQLRYGYNHISVRVLFLPIQPSCNPGFDNGTGLDAGIDRIN